MTHSPDFQPSDHLWRTTDVAAYLGISLRKVSQTVRRWGVFPVPNPVVVHIRRGGAPTFYRARDVVTGRGVLRCGRYQPATFPVGERRYGPESVRAAFRLDPRPGRRIFLVAWPSWVGMDIYVYPDPRDGVHHVEMDGRRLPQPEYQRLLANWFYLDVSTGELRASLQLEPYADVLARGVEDAVARVCR